MQNWNHIHSTASQSTTPLFCLWIWLLQVSCIKRNDTVFAFFHLAYFTWRNILKVYYAATSEFPSYSRLDKILLYVCITFFLHHVVYKWTLGCFHLSATVQCCNEREGTVSLTLLFDYIPRTEYVLNFFEKRSHCFLQQLYHLTFPLIV